MTIRMASMCFYSLAVASLLLPAFWVGRRLPDWVINGDLTVGLRAERSGRGNGRIYKVMVGCVDDSGNESIQNSVSVVLTLHR